MSGELFTLMGVLVGAAASYVGGALMERSRRRRQLSTRWDERRLEVHLRYADAIKRFTSMTGRLAAGKGLFDLPQPLPQDVGLERLADAELERGYAFEAVLLMGDADTFLDGAGLWIGPDAQFGSWHLVGHGVAPLLVGPGGEDGWER